jgi:dCMP deaminase
MKIPRTDWDTYWMLMAHLTATRNTCDRGPELLFDPGRHGVGAVLVRDKRMIAGGYNGSAPGQPHCDEIRCDSCGMTSITMELVDTPHEPKKCRSRLPYDTDYVTYETGVWQGGHLMRDGHCVRTIHSEMNALLQCALDGVSPAGATLYCTASPCFDCAKAIIRAGIVKIFVGEHYESRYGLSSDVKDMLNQSGISVETLALARENFR